MESEANRRQRLYRVSAIVLKRHDQGEADRLLTVFTRDRGKLTLLAKGVRKPASRKAGHILSVSPQNCRPARSNCHDNAESLLHRYAPVCGVFPVDVSTEVPEC